MGGVKADTIYALSSGSPPAAIAVVRISGPKAEEALRRLAGKSPPPRVAQVATLRQLEDGEALDRALLLRFPGPASATGEDLVELHLHGGRAVVAAVLAELGRVDGLRSAQPGEFTRRAFENGRIDLAEAEGLADLLEAETESQRRSALALVQGGLSRTVAGWQDRLLRLGAQIEAVIDFSDEGEVGGTLPATWTAELTLLREEMEDLRGKPPAERLREGIRTVIAGPPNAGKSSLLNSLAGRDASITAATAGTTRDLVEAPTSIRGTPFLLVDTAGLRDSCDEVEAIGIERAHRSLAEADLILWLGRPTDCPDRSRSIIVQSKMDIVALDVNAEIHVSAVTGEGIGLLMEAIVARAAHLLPKEGEVALGRRQRAEIGEAARSLADAVTLEDLVLQAEALRYARVALDRITGRAGVEDMLDLLFARFCIGK